MGQSGVTLWPVSSVLVTRTHVRWLPVLTDGFPLWFRRPPLFVSAAKPYICGLIACLPACLPAWLALPTCLPLLSNNSTRLPSALLSCGQCSLPMLSRLFGSAVRLFAPPARSPPSVRSGIVVTTLIVPLF